MTRLRESSGSSYWKILKRMFSASSQTIHDQLSSTTAVTVPPSLYLIHPIALRTLTHGHKALDISIMTNIIVVIQVCKPYLH